MINITEIYNYLIIINKNNINIVYKYFFNYNNKIINIITTDDNNLYKYYQADQPFMYNIVCILMIIELYLYDSICDINLNNYSKINYILLYSLSRLQYYKKYNSNIPIYNYNNTGIDIIYIYKAIKLFCIIPYNFNFSYNILDQSSKTILTYTQTYNNIFFNNLFTNDLLLIYQNYIYLCYITNNNYAVLQIIKNNNFNNTNYIKNILLKCISNSSKKINNLSSVFISFLHNDNINNYINNSSFNNNPNYYIISDLLSNINNINTTIIVNYLYNNLTQNICFASYTTSNNIIPNIIQNNTFIINDILFYYNISNKITITSLIHNLDIIDLDNDIINNDYSDISGIYDNDLIKNIVAKIQLNKIIYCTMFNATTNYDYLLQYKYLNILNTNDTNILNNLYNSKIKKLKYVNNILHNNDYENITLNDIITQILNIIIYGYSTINININNNIYTKNIFKCLVLYNNNNSYFYMIDIIEDYFALVKINNVSVYNINITFP